MAIAFPPARSISLTTDAAASAPFVYVMATCAPSAARRLAIAAPMPREPPVMSAIFPSSFICIIFSPILLIVISNLVKHLLLTVVFQFECDVDKIDARFATVARTSAFSTSVTIPSIDQSELVKGHGEVLTYLCHAGWRVPFR